MHSRAPPGSAKPRRYPKTRMSSSPPAVPPNPTTTPRTPVVRPQTTIRLLSRRGGTPGSCGKSATALRSSVSLSRWPRSGVNDAAYGFRAVINRALIASYPVVRPPKKRPSCTGGPGRLRGEFAGSDVRDSVGAAPGWWSFALDPDGEFVGWERCSLDGEDDAMRPGIGAAAQQFAVNVGIVVLG